MNMHLFILPSKTVNAGGYMTVGSFPSECLSKVTFVPNFMKINITTKEAVWFGVFYDNEYIDKEVRKNLSTFLMTIGNNSLVMFKKNYIKNSADYCPRIFRSGMVLDSPFHTRSELEFEKILNGWICEHGKN